MTGIAPSRHVVSEVVRVALRDDEYATIDLATAERRLITLDLTLGTIAPVVMAMFSAGSALQDRRHAATGARDVLALPIIDAVGQAVPHLGERHVVVSLRLPNEAIFRFSLPPAAAVRLARTLAEATGPGLN